MTTEALTHDDEIRRIITHSLGISLGKKAYRIHYCHDSTPALEEAVARGLMSGPHTNGMAIAPYWFVLPAGAQFVGSEFPK